MSAGANKNARDRARLAGGGAASAHRPVRRVPATSVHRVCGRRIGPQRRAAVSRRLAHLHPVIDPDIRIDTPARRRKRTEPNGPPPSSFFFFFSGKLTDNCEY